MAGCGALAGLAALAGRGPRPAAGALHSGRRVQLVREDGTPWRGAAVVPHRTYVFHYPYESTPCFLLDLGRPVPGAEVSAAGGAAYGWSGGVGASRSIVAYAAICSHTYTHPTRENALIRYYAPGEPATLAARGAVITCCTHGSAFDPGQAAVPLTPPAELPLAAIALEWDASADTFHAVGVVGRPVFEEFFKAFAGKSRREVGPVAPVRELDRYSRAVLSC